MSRIESAFVSRIAPPNPSNAQDHSTGSVLVFTAKSILCTPSISNQQLKTRTPRGRQFGTDFLKSFPTNRKNGLRAAVGIRDHPATPMMCDTR
jgi:hypothetical protein